MENGNRLYRQTWSIIVWLWRITVLSRVLAEEGNLSWMACKVLLRMCLCHLPSLRCSSKSIAADLFDNYTEQNLSSGKKLQDKVSSPKPADFARLLAVHRGLIPVSTSKLLNSATIDPTLP